MKTHAVLLFWVLSATMAAAQTVPPAMMVRSGDRSVPLGLSKLATEIRIFGAVAETTMTMTFTNPQPRVMEGDLYFPLPEGATISGYALDINGQMVDGVAVDKHEARRVYEEVVRQGIDPGLVQWTGGNNFQTRVFPIPAGGSRTVRVSYVSELIGDRGAPAYLLPLKFKDKIGEFTLRVEVVKSSAAPRVTKGELANFAFEKWQQSYVAETRQRDWLPVEDMVIALPKTDVPQVLVEKADDGSMYYAVQDYPHAPAAAPALADVHHAVVFWDASGSRAGDHQREIILLKQFLGRLLPDQAGRKNGKIDVDLVQLRNVAATPVRLGFSWSDQASLAKALEKIDYDGGTQLGAIGPLAGAEKPDLYLLFTDGISNFGSEQPAALDAPLYVFSAAATTNHAFLHSLALANGGQYFNLANWKDADILAQAGRSAWSFLGATAEHQDGKDLYPQRPQPVADRFLLVGKLAEPAATVHVKYGLKGGRTESRTFEARGQEAVKGELLRRLWAQKKLAELLIHQKANMKEIAALGKKFGLVTPYTSLLVLDSLEQYVQYEIAPPKSLAAMREEYLRRVDTVEHQRKKQKADKQEMVLRMWQERLDWYHREFKYPKDFKFQDGQAGNGEFRYAPGGGGAGFGRAMGGLAPAEPAAMPAGTAPAPAPRVEPPLVNSPVPDARPADAAPSLSANASVNERYAVRSASARAAQAGERPAAVRPGTFHDEAQLQRSDRRAELRVRQTLARVATPEPAKPAAEAKADESKQLADAEYGIAIKSWDPATPYLKDLRAAKGRDEQHAVYFRHRAQFGETPAYFLDCADFFRTAGDSDFALQVLSNIAELQLEEAALLRVLGHCLEQIDELDLAAQTFQQVLELRPEEPQSYRDLALVLAQRAERGVKTGSRSAVAIRDDYARAIDLFVQIVNTPWDGRFPEVEVIALEEANHIIPQAKAAGVSTIPLDARLIVPMEIDVRIVMTWHADNTDIDLWVTEPSRERAYYSYNRTRIGGLVSRDFTQGYGPEEYLLRRAPKGKYRIEANYFGVRATRLLGPVTVQADVYTDYGRPTEQHKSLTLRLTDTRETVVIGEVER